MIVSILAWALLTALVVMLGFPASPSARALRRALVEAPARFLLDFAWRKAGTGMLVAAGFVIIALSGPELLFFFGAAGLLDAAMLELFALLALSAVSGNLTSAWRAARRLPRAIAIAVRRIASPRARTSRRRTRRPPKADDNSEPGWAFA